MTSDPEDEAIDALYRAPREGFIEARNALAKRFMAQGHAAAADRVRALPKPSVSAWAVNQLWWFHREAYDALHAAGAELMELQQMGASVAGQPANDARRAALDTLRKTAAKVLADAGHAASAGTLRKISQSLEASAAGGSFGSQARLGRLHTELAPPTFGQVVQFTPDGAPARLREAKARRGGAELEHARATRELADATAVLRAAEQTRTDAEAALRRARTALDDAAEALSRAQTRHRQASATHDATKRALDEATDAEHEATRKP